MDQLRRGVPVWLTWLLSGALSAAPLVAGGVPFAAPVALAGLEAWGQRAIADVDGDGDPDLLAASDGSGGTTLRWYELQDGSAPPEFTEHLIFAFGGNELATHLVAVDLDRDGDVDAALLADDADDDTVTLLWAENDGTPADGGWTRHDVVSWDPPFGGILQSGAGGGLAAGDVDGDGDADLVAAYAEWEIFETDADGRTVWLRSDGSPANGGWSSEPLVDWSTDRTYSNFVLADLDGDADLDLVLDSNDTDLDRAEYLQWAENDGTPGVGFWLRRLVADLSDDFWPTQAAVADFDRDGDLDLACADGEAAAARWFQNDGSPGDGGWTSRTVTSPGDREDLVAADVDRDGDPDLVGFAGWYENDGTPASGAWTARTVIGLTPERADLDRDGDVDALRFGEDWAENLEIHRSGSLREERGVNTLVDEAFDVAVGDLDGDGDPDLVSAAEANDHVYWHRSDGTPGDQSVWSLSTLSSAVDGPRAVAIGDLDGDGDLDVVVASYNDDSVSWLENDGTLANWTKRVISAGAGGANDVALGDFDRDGDLDVACAQYLDNEISWYRNSGASPPTFGGFFVDSLPYDGPRALAVGDIDADGDLDLAAVSETTDRVVWYGNDGTPADAEWARHRTDNGESDGPKEVALADLDRDGDLDTLVANYVGGDFLWYENDGTLAGWTAHAITTCNGARGVAAGDFDGDGDLDALVSCFDEDRVKLQRSNGASPPDLATTVSSWLGANGARTVVAADLDRDGDLDGAVAQGVDDQIAWYENRGGQFRVSGAAAAGNPLYNDQLEAVLRATATHRGRAGDTALELAAVPVRLEESAGDPLNAFQAAALIDSVRLYGDDGDLLFEPASDPLVGSVSPAGIDGQGVVWIDLAPDQVAARVSAQQQKSFFVVLELAQPFGLFAAGTATLRASLVSSSPAPEAVDADFDLPLDAEWAADAPTALLVLLDVVFRDDLESGGLANWSSHLP